MQGTAGDDRTAQATAIDDGDDDVADDQPRPAPSVDPLRTWARGIPKVVWWITALNLVVLVGYSLLFPTYRSPDEPLHVDLAHLFSEEGRYPAWDDRYTGSGIQRSLGLVEFGTQSKHLTADEAPPKDERPSIEDLEAVGREGGINQLPQHPPLYYVTVGGAERVAEIVTSDDTPDFQLETWFYRMLSVLMVAPLPLVIWRIAGLLRLPEAIGVAACLVPLAIPQLLHISSSVNNDALVMSLIWLITPVVLRIAGGALSPRTALLAGSLTGLALLTKMHAFMMAVWVFGALVLVLVRRGRAALDRIVRFGLQYGVVSMAIGGWWWVRNLVLYGKLNPSRQIENLGEIHDPKTDVAEFVSQWGRVTTRRFWGDFGWYDVRLPGYVVALATAVVLVGLIACCAGRDRVAGTDRGSRLLLGAPLLLLAGGQFIITLQGHLQTGRYGGLQGRYWYGAVAAIAVAVPLGIANLARRWVDVLPVVALTCVAAIQLVTFVTVSGFYWGAPGSSMTDRVRALVAWAPLPGELIGVLGIIGVAVAVGAATGVVSFSRRTMAARP
jgi:small subunit ribosomal protein S36